MRIIGLVVLLCLFFIGVTPVHACSCGRGDFMMSDFLSHDEVVVFTGMAISTSQDPLSSELEDALRGPITRKYAREIVKSYREKGVEPDQWVTQFSVKHVYQGGVPDIMKIRHNTQATACGIIPQFFKTDLIIAGRRNGEYYTSSCSRRRMPAEAVKTYFETGRDVFLPDRPACYHNSKQACEAAEGPYHLTLKNPCCTVYKGDIASCLDMIKNRRQVRKELD